MEKEFNSMYLGIVVQNNDPQKRGRVKVFVPHLSPTIYENWVGDNKDKFFKSIDGNLEPIMAKLKTVLPWAEVSCPLTSENTSKRYNNYTNKATASDTNSFTNLSADNSTSSGEIYDQSMFRLSDAFNDSSNNINNVNPYSFNYKPNTYSNKAKGSFGIPSVGAHVYVFFRDGNTQFPVIMGTSFGKDDWQGIYDNEVDYPGKFENYDSSSTEEDYNVKTYRNKYVLNQKGGTFEINNTDHNEKIKLTHYSGSFKEFNNNTNSELATKNNQKLVINDEFSTVKGFKNEFTGKNYDEIILRDKYKKIGNLNEAFFDEWKQAFGVIQDKKQLFDIKRAEDNNIKSNGDIILKLNSIQQKRIGSFSAFPVINTLKYAALNNINTFDTTLFPGLNISSFNSAAGGGGTPIFDKNLSILQAGTSKPKEPAQLKIGTTVKSWPSESGQSFVNGDGKSPSTQDGSWKPQDKTLSDDILKIQADLMIKERDFGLGGSEIIEISKNKLENIGTVMNDYGSVRFDPIGKLVNNEVLVGSNATYVNSDSGPLLEYVDVQDLPGGTYNLNVNNRYNVMVGAGGINLKSYGPTNISGSITNVAGQQVNIGSENEINIDGKVVNISADILRLRNKRQRQVLIDSSLGVNNNVVIGGGLSVEGETYLQHVTAPSETQVTNTTQALGQTVQNAIIGYVNYSWTDPSGNNTVPVYGGSMTGISCTDTIATYPHTHTFSNIPLTLTDGNESVRNSAKNQGINSKNRVVATPQFNTLKTGTPVETGNNAIGVTDVAASLITP
tara:strand:- start:231 stop:2579 length:2349 start_codon:yes stop_codon:yes gene_type:complete